MEHDILTHSPLMRVVLDAARRAAHQDSTILVCGPTGSGKEMVANLIHKSGSRSARPFVAINCAAVPSELLESELFGHKRGAFTGATHDHLGLFRAAEGGTVLLDEIGDMEFALQAKLLRVLQERQVRPVGELRSIPINVRVVAVTHRDLDAMVATGSFREDLFYRLNVVRLHLPSLAQRREDVPLLVAQHLIELTRTAAKKVFSPEAMERLVAFDWPGNIRQLFNVVEQAVAMSTDRVIDAALVDRMLGRPADRLLPLDTARDEFIRGYLLQCLRIADGNVSSAARLAGRNRTDFYKLMRKHNISGHA